MERLKRSCLAPSSELRLVPCRLLVYLFPKSLESKVWAGVLCPLLESKGGEMHVNEWAGNKQTQLKEWNCGLIASTLLKVQPSNE